MAGHRSLDAEGTFLSPDVDFLHRHLGFKSFLWGFCTHKEKSLTQCHMIHLVSGAVVTGAWDHFLFILQS